MCIHSQNGFFFEMCIHSQNVKTVGKVSWVFFIFPKKNNCKQSQLTKVCKICIVTSKSFWWGRVNYDEIYKALEFVSVVRNPQFITSYKPANSYRKVSYLRRGRKEVWHIVCFNAMQQNESETVKERKNIQMPRLVYS